MRKELLLFLLLAVFPLMASADEQGGINYELNGNSGDSNIPYKAGVIAKSWGKYSGEPEEGPVVAYWLCKDYSPETIAQKTKTSLEFVNGVLFKFRNFLMVIGKAHRSSKPYMEDYIVNLWAIEMGKTK